jgi:hypothetical protein
MLAKHNNIIGIIQIHTQNKLARHNKIIVGGIHVQNKLAGIIREHRRMLC